MSDGQIAFAQQSRVSLAQAAADWVFDLFGVRITDVTRPRAVELISGLLGEPAGGARRVYFVNAHTLNLAVEDPEYRTVLNAADYVFGDGTGVRWAARMRGIRVRDNVNGTDLVPELLDATAAWGLRCFLLGAEPHIAQRAAWWAAARFSGWRFVGWHHGFLDAELNRQVIAQINRQRPHLLLVAQGNPLQERWIHRHAAELEVAVAMGVGGLLNFWSGAVPRAPHWMRQWGIEWVWVLLHQRHKARRYLVGNPKFLARALADAWRHRRLESESADSAWPGK